MSDLPRLGLACALTPHQDEWSLQLTPVSVRSNETKAQYGQTEILKLHSQKDYDRALETMFETIDDIIQEKHKGKVKIAFGIDRRTSISEIVEDKLNPFIKHIQNLVGTKEELKTFFESRIDQLSAAICKLFKQKESITKDNCKVEVRQYSLYDYIQEHLESLEKDRWLRKDKLASSMDQYFRTLTSSLVPIDHLFELAFVTENPKQPRFFPFGKIQSPKHQRFELARQAIARNINGKRDELVKRIVDGLKCTKPFTIKFFGVDTKLDQPSAPYSDVVAGMLYEDEAQEDPSIRRQYKGSVYIP